MIPRNRIGTALIPGTNIEMQLYQSGELYSIKIPGRGDLMNSRMHGSEEALATLACGDVRTMERPRVLVGGLGMGFTLRAVLDLLPSDAIVTVAELVPAVIEWNRERLAALAAHPLKDARVRVEVADVGFTLRGNPGRYDVILLDAYRGPFVPFHLTTQEFYRLVKSRLSEGGVVAQNVEPSTMFFDSAYATMKSVFANVDTFYAGGKIVLIGYGGERLTAPELARRAAAVQEKWKLKYDLRELVKARKDVTIAGDAKVLTDDFAPVEMLKTIKRHNEKKAQ